MSVRRPCQPLQCLGQRPARRQGRGRAGAVPAGEPAIVPARLRLPSSASRRDPRSARLQRQGTHGGHDRRHVLGTGAIGLSLDLPGALLGSGNTSPGRGCDLLVSLGNRLGTLGLGLAARLRHPGRRFGPSCLAPSLSLGERRRAGRGPTPRPWSPVRRRRPRAPLRARRDGRPALRWPMPRPASQQDGSAAAGRACSACVQPVLTTDPGTSGLGPAGVRSSGPLSRRSGSRRRSASSPAAGSRSR